MTIMRVLRHASIAVTQQSYIKIRDHVVENAVDVLSKAAEIQGDIRLKDAGKEA